jgi:putative ABC transport system permease protein
MNMKKILASVRIALRALQVNRLRSSLTHAGHHYRRGCSDLHGGSGIGRDGAHSGTDCQHQNNVIIVLSGSITSNGIRLGSGAARTLSSDDAKAIASECSAVAAVAPAVRGSGQVVFREQQLVHQLSGHDAGLPDDSRLHHAIRQRFHHAGC